MLGKTLGGRYQIIQPLAVGGFGQTYLAKDKHRPKNPLCVVKQLKPQSTNPFVLQTAQRLFNEEAEVLERLGKHDQIPQLYAHFEEDQEFYLVEELIEGHDLAQELKPGEKLSDTHVITLLRDVLEILDFVHQQGVIHRDIKPSNLIRRKRDGKLVLIDFGTVKQISDLRANSPGQMHPTVPIHSQGYTPIEQLGGHPQFNSDIYALGMMGIQALAGRFPNELQQDTETGEISWHEQVGVSSALRRVLDKMVRRDFRERYQSVQEVLRDLTSEYQIMPSGSETAVGNSRLSWLPTGSKTVKAFLILFVLSTAGLIIGKLIPSTPPQPVSSSLLNNQVSNQVSEGQTILVREDKNPLKQSAVQAYAAGEFDKAIQQLQSSLNVNRNDPEARIYLNNAKAAKGSNLKIAVSVPIGGNLNIAKEMLRGVAQAQEEINSKGGINGALLQVVIANDSNNEEIGKQLAAEFVKDDQILAVVGHNASEVSIAVAPVYQRGGLVMISPTSGAKALSGIASYVFRTLPSNPVDASTLALYAVRTARKTKFVICTDSTSPYSQSLTDEFKETVFELGGNISPVSCDFSDPKFNPSHVLSEAISDGADSLVLLPSVPRMNQAIDMAKINQGRLDLLSGTTMYTFETLKRGQVDVNGMVLTVMWHPTAFPGNPFPSNAEKLWGGPVNWRTAMAYDATLVIAAGLQQKSTRNGLQKVLSSPGFSVSGATGTLEFLPSGDRKGTSMLVRVQPGKVSGTGYDFVAIPDAVSSP